MPTSLLIKQVFLLALYIPVYITNLLTIPITRMCFKDRVNAQEDVPPTRIVAAEDDNISGAKKNDQP